MLCGTSQRMRVVLPLWLCPDPIRCSNPSPAPLPLSAPVPSSPPSRCRLRPLPPRSPPLHPHSCLLFTPELFVTPSQGVQRHQSGPGLSVGQFVPAKRRGRSLLREGVEGGPMNRWWESQARQRSQEVRQILGRPGLVRPEGSRRPFLVCPDPLCARSSATGSWTYCQPSWLPRRRRLPGSLRRLAAP